MQLYHHTPCPISTISIGIMEKSYNVRILVVMGLDLWAGDSGFLLGRRCLKMLTHASPLFLVEDTCWIVKEPHWSENISVSS